MSNTTKEGNGSMKVNIKRLKAEYTPGTKIRLIHMAGEPQMKPGITGTVDCVDDIGQIHMNWENGSSLALDISVDKFEKI